MQLSSHVFVLLYIASVTFYYLVAILSGFSCQENVSAWIAEFRKAEHRRAGGEGGRKNAG